MVHKKPWKHVKDQPYIGQNLKLDLTPIFFQKITFGRNGWKIVVCHLHNLKNLKTPMEERYLKHVTLLKVTLLQKCLSRLNCTNSKNHAKCLIRQPRFLHLLAVKGAFPSKERLSFVPPCECFHGSLTHYIWFYIQIPLLQ